MPAFTLTVQQVIDLNKDLTPYAALGLDTYPLFDEAYRAELNDKIIAHYNEQEIGHETDSMFRYAMRRKMNEVMPLFNQHYRASQISIDPLRTVDIHNIGENKETSEGTDTSTTESTTTAGGRVVASNTPQVRLSGNGDYATSAQDSNSTTDAGGTASATNNRDNTATNNNVTTGYQGNPAELIWSLRQSFVNVDMMVIESLTELFSLIWDTGEEFTRGYNYNVYPGFYPFYG